MRADGGKMIRHFVLVSLALILLIGLGTAASIRGGMTRLWGARVLSAADASLSRVEKDIRDMEDRKILVEHIEQYLSTVMYKKTDSMKETLTRELLETGLSVASLQIRESGAGRLVVDVQGTVEQEGLVPFLSVFGSTGRIWHIDALDIRPVDSQNASEAEKAAVEKKGQSLVVTMTFSTITEP